MSVDALRKALTVQAIADVDTEFHQVLSGLGVSDVDTVEVSTMDMRPDDVMEGQPHYLLSLDARVQTDFGSASVTLVLENDFGGFISVDLIAAGNTQVVVNMPFLPGQMSPEDVVALVKRAVERRTWLYNRMVARERELGLSV